jgi:hypothetical protein
LRSYKQRLFKSIIDDTKDPSGYRPNFAYGYTPEHSPKFFVAGLTLLRLFKELNHSRSSSFRPTFIPWNQCTGSGKALVEIGLDFANLSSDDLALLQDALTKSSGSSLYGTLSEKLFELGECADLLQKNKDFLKTYEALRIDLLAK